MKRLARWNKCIIAKWQSVEVFFLLYELALYDIHKSINLFINNLVLSTPGDLWESSDKFPIWIIPYSFSLHILHTYTCIYICIYVRVCVHIYIERDTHTQTNRHRDRHRNWQTDRQTEILKCVFAYYSIKPSNQFFHLKWLKLFEVR